MSGAYAVVLTHNPETGETLYTPFWESDYEDPLSAAHAFREAEEERGDVPGWLWTVTGDDRARDIRSASMLKALGIEGSLD